jgi:hypothetical protein
MQAWLTDVVRFPVNDGELYGSAAAAGAARQRYEIEDIWRAKLDAAFDRFSAASEEYRRILESRTDTGPALSDDSLERARKIRTEALAECSRLLHIFSDLTLHGKKPEESA